jgi:drug/metabolite transporter (DMT)-like permease
MKLNMWQWIGVALLAIGLILFVVKRNRNAERPPGSDTTPTVTVPAATTPATTTSPR